MNHADHEWAKEQIAAHLAGGLSAEERARLEAHAAGCAECIAELDAARRFDRSMDELFAPIRANADLEERVIRTLRTAPAPKARPFASVVFRGVAAIVLVGVLGAALMNLDGVERAVMSEKEAPPAAMSPVDETRSYWAKLDGIDGTPSHKLLDGKRAELETADDLASTRVMAGATFSLDEPARAGAERLHGEPQKQGGAGRYEGRSGGRPLSMPALQAPPPPPPAAPMPAPEAKPEPAKDPVLALVEREKDGDKKLFYSLRSEADHNESADTENYFKPPTNAAPAKPTVAAPEAAKTNANKLGEKLDKEAGKLGKVTTGALPADGKQLQAGTTPQETQPQPPQPQRKIIRTGEVEYEIESFDSAVGTISKLVEEEQGFVATVNSDKLPNGKVRGTVVLRVPPERLDTLLLKLRGLGELKSQNIRSQDVGKQYYDLESRLRAARTMEERLLKIIKEGKGEIKDLLAAEKELGEWRTKIESFEGELRYYNNQISLSTLTVTLMEKEIRSPSAVTETERVQMGIEAEDVEKAHKAALLAVVEAKGRVTKSELKQLAAGQYSALVNFEVAPDAAGPIRDRLKQLGNVARLDIDRVQETEGGIGKIQEFLKVKVKDTQYFVSIYNLANMQPRETHVLNLACADTEASYKTILARVDKAGGRVVTSNLNHQRKEQTSGQIVFEVKTADADAVLADIRVAGEVMSLVVNENRDTQAVTKSKKGFQVQLYAMGLVEPKETTTITLAARDVPAAYRKLQEAVSKADARVTMAQLNENDRQNVSASLYFDIHKDQEAAILAAFKDAGEIMTRSSARAQDTERVVESKRRFNLTLINLANVAIRETYTIAIESDHVDGVVTTLEAMAAEVKGRVVDSRHTRASGGRNVSKVTIDLPLSSARGSADRVKAMGTVRVFDAARNPQAPEGELAVGRLEVTISNPSQLVDAESGPWARIKGGLSVGLTMLSWSLTFVIVGLCFLLPIGLIGWGGLKLYRKSKAKAA